ncbi:kelch repeat and BTB domain-containing protein 8-like [Rhinophrynus dorsalis]
MQGLRELYLNEELCDTTIVTEGKQFFCHRVLLASISPYFRAMFCCPMKESSLGEVQLLDISTSVMEAVLHFVYTGEVSINLNTVHDLFTVSSRLQIIPLLDRCSSYLLKEIGDETCFWIYRMAHSHNCRSLLDAAVQYIGWHFSILCEKEDFLHLDLNELTTILSSDRLMVCSELSIYRLACRWWDFHNPENNSLPEELLEVIRFPLMSPNEKEVVEKNIGKERVRQELTNIQLRQGMFEDRIVCMDRAEIDEKSQKDKDFYMESFDPVSGGWQKLSSPKFLMSPGLLTVGRHLYISGGVNKDKSYSNTLHIYESLTNEWTQLPSMTFPRSNHGFLEHNQRLYALGGWNIRDTLDSVECFNLDQNCWKRLSNMPVPLHDFVYAQLKGKLYLIGGCRRQIRYNANHQGFLIYDTVSDTWSQFPLKMKCSPAGAVILDNKIFVVGGSTFKYTNTNQYAPPVIFPPVCFCLDEVGRDCHCPVPRLPENLISFCVVRWKQRIYVLGGQSREEHSYKILYWTPGDSKWTTCREEIPFLLDSRFGCVTLQIPMKHLQAGGQSANKAMSETHIYDSSCTALLKICICCIKLELSCT